MILVTEIGDETFIIAALMAMRHPKSIVLSGALSAFFVMTILSTGLGRIVRNLISRKHTNSATVARFDFSWGDAEYHQQTLENLRAAVKNTRKLCAVMLDTVGPELQVVNKTELPISLKEDSFVVLSADQDKDAYADLLPINLKGYLK